jgi:hypothetical protein
MVSFILDPPGRECLRLRCRGCADSKKTPSHPCDAPEISQVKGKAWHKATPHFIPQAAFEEGIQPLWLVSHQLIGHARSPAVTTPIAAFDEHTNPDTSGTVRSGARFLLECDNAKYEHNKRH